MRWSFAHYGQPPMTVTIAEALEWVVARMRGEVRV